MRKTLIVITMGLMLTQTVTAQVFDDEKYLQWRSMETGPLGFAPKEYYWLFHNSGNGSGMDCFIVDSI